MYFQEEASGVIVYQEEAVKALLESLTCEQNFSVQALSASILSNLGGTYSWLGEPYTVAWLVKKTGLTLLHHKNMIKNYDFADGSLQVSSVLKFHSNNRRCCNFIHLNETPWITGCWHRNMVR